MLITLCTRVFCEIRLQEDDGRSGGSIEFGCPLNI